MGMRVSTTSWIVFGSYLVVVGTIGLMLLISLVVVFRHVTLMPRRNLDSHVCCSHMIELLGARWCLGMCDVTHCDSLLCNLTIVLTSNLSQGYRVNERLVSRKRTVLRRVLYCVHRKLMRVCIIFYAPHICINTWTSSSLHHGVCIIEPVS